MSGCKALFLTSLASLHPNFNPHSVIPIYRSPTRPSHSLSSFFATQCTGNRDAPYKLHSRTLSAVQVSAIPPEPSDPSPEDETVEHLLANRDNVARLMKMERRSSDGRRDDAGSLWFPYLDRFRCGDVYLSSREVLEAVGPHLMEERRERLRRVADNRSFSVCLVVEGLTDFGNVSAAFRSADAMGVQSVHVVSCDSSKRYRGNRHVSKGAEKWLDIELWDSPKDCFKVLKSRGYHIASTHLGTDTVSIYDMDWSRPTAIVVGNEKEGISVEALELSDLSCSIPMNGMVDSFNVSVAAGILMHRAVCDRISRLGCHGDLTEEQRQILLAEFLLRHSKSAISIVHEYAKRKEALLCSNL